MAKLKKIALLLIIVFSVTNILNMLGFTMPTTPVKAAGQLTGCTAKTIVDDMGLGWNLGNTFDATGGNRANIYSQETSWGNPKVTPELIKAVHDRGFKTIRIPVTWNNHIIKDGSYTINPEF
ncbi:MAG: cellulase family glycosylhydrolase, partial [Lachnospiraceae bacterium]|nr:cellulase family glycosylhydrolase [Lachnospiraceae bacterium]